VPERLKRGFFEENEEISWDNFSRLGNGILKGVVWEWEWEMGNRK
jgi:hypothetical protein